LHLTANLCGDGNPVSTAAQSYPNPPTNPDAYTEPYPNAHGDRNSHPHGFTFSNSNFYWNPKCDLANRAYGAGILRPHRY